MTLRDIPTINAKIKQRQAVVYTADAFKALVQDQGVAAAARQVDVVVAGTFEPMEASGAILNLGHTDPPINIRDCTLDGVGAYAGFGAVDLYIGASQPVDIDRAGDNDTDDLRDRGGGHVIADLVAGRGVQLQARGHVTDCYPKAALTTTITKDTINQFYLFCPRGLYQNFIVGVNGGDRLLHTYLGPLQPQLGNAVYANPGALAPLMNDPHLETVGIGTRIFLGGGVGYIGWEGTQHFPLQKRLPNGTPIGPAATVALVGDAKQMQVEWVRGCYLKGYGPSLMLGAAVPIPVLNEGVAQSCAVQDQDVVAPVIDFSIPRRVRPTFGLVSYAQLKSGHITLEGTTVRTAPIASLYLAQQAALTLKGWIEAGQFELTQAVSPLPLDRLVVSHDSLTP